MAFRRQAFGTGHAYYDSDGRKVPGVTTILRDGFPIRLVDWAAKSTAKDALANLDRLAAMEREEAYDWLRGAPARHRSKATARGKDIHSHGEALARDDQTAHDVPPELIGPVEAYARWLDRRAVAAIHVECPVINRKWDYCGTFDLVARIGETNWLLDIKTGERVFDDAALQLAAYAHAEALLVGGLREIELPRIDRVGIVHVQPDQVDLLPVDVSDGVWRTFLYVRQVYDYVHGMHPIGEPLPEPPDPDAPRYRLVKVYDHDDAA